MHVVVSGWFWGQPHTGSGQYLHRLLPHLAAQSASPRETNAEDRPDHHQPHDPDQRANNRKPTRYTLLLPRNPEHSEHPDALAAYSSQLAAVVAPPPPLPRQLAKLYWEQVTVPRLSRNLGADLLLVPYWAAPLWQPAPTVVTVHDLIPLLLPPYRGGWTNRLYTTLVSASARRCSAVLTVSEASKRDIVSNLGLPEERVMAVYHGPNREDNVAEQTEADAVLSRNRQVAGKYALPERYFLYLGGFDVRKNLVRIVRAYRRYLDLGGDPGVKLVVAGKLPHTDTPFFPDPQRLVHQLELTDYVRFIGWVDEEDKEPLFAGAAAFLFPSLYEGFGMMLLEAMTAGSPVITSSE